MNLFKKKFFTLIELIAVMAIFIVIVAIVMGLYNTAHKATSATNEHTMTFENAKIALDLMTKELQCIYYENDTIPFWWHKLDDKHSETAWNVYRNELLAFITATSYKPNENCTTKLCEVKYQLYYTNDGTNSNAGWLRRSVTGNKLSTYDALGYPKDNPKWNYYNNLTVGYTTNTMVGTDTPIASFTANSMSSENFQKVIPYVTDLTFDCFDETGASILPDNSTAITSDDCSSTELPFSIELTLKVMDKNSWQKWLNIGGDPSLGNEESKAEDFRKKHERTFKKTILIGNRGQYD